MGEVRGKAAAACALRSLMCVRVVGGSTAQSVDWYHGRRKGVAARDGANRHSVWNAVLDAPLEATVLRPPPPAAATAVGA